MKKNVIWWPALKNPNHLDKYGGFDYYEYSRKSWEYWCKKNDWVIFAKYAGSRLNIEGGELRLLNDDEILGVVEDPESILSPVTH